MDLEERERGNQNNNLKAAKNYFKKKS